MNITCPERSRRTKKIVYLFFSFVFAFALSFSALADHNTSHLSPSTSLDTNLATTSEITNTDLGVGSPNFFEFFKRRLARIFTFSSVKKAKLSLELANLTLLKARQAQKAGNTELAGQLVDSYNQQIVDVSTQVGTLISQFKGTGNAQVDSLVTSLEQNNLLQASLIDSMNLKATGEFNKKLTKVRLKIIKELSKLLSKEDLSPEKLATKLDKLANKLAEKEAKIEKKLAKRLAALDEIDQADELDEDLEEAIDQAEDKIKKDIENQPEDRLGAIASEIQGSVEKHLLILQELLTRAPESAKPAIQKAIDNALELLAKKAANEQKEEIKKNFEKDKKNIEHKKEILKKIKEKIKDVEKDIEDDLKDEEEDMKKEEKKSESPRSGTESTTTQPSSGSGSSGSGSTETAKESEGAGETEAKTYEVKFKESSFEKGSLTIKKGDTITFKNDGDATIDIASNPHPIHTQIPGLRSGSLSKGQSYSFKFDVSAGTYGVHNHPYSSQSMTIVVE